MVIYLPFLRQWSTMLGLRPEDADDLVQDVMITVLKKLSSFDYDPKGSFRGWLRGIMTNKVRERRKAAFVRKRVSMPVDDVPDREVPEPDEAEYNRAVVNGCLELIRSEFEAKSFKAFELCKMHGKSARDVADELGMTVDAVYKNVSRVMSRLRNELQGLCD